MKKLLLVTGALLMATSYPTFAAGQNQNPANQMMNKYPMTFTQLDTNADGVLSKDEVCGRLLANFDTVDSDASGTLSVDEFNARINLGRQGHHKGNTGNRPTFEQLDFNSDGLLAKDEVRGRLLANFDTVDSDASGTLSADEFNAHINLGRQGHHKNNTGNRPTFEQLDFNSDGLLAKDEVRGRLLANFDTVDSDGSGTLSADEFNVHINLGRQGNKGNTGNRANRPTFEQLDINGDAMLSAEEFNAGVNNRQKMSN